MATSLRSFFSNIVLWRRILWGLVYVILTLLLLLHSRYSFAIYVALIIFLGIKELKVLFGLTIGAYDQLCMYILGVALVLMGVSTGAKQLSNETIILYVCIPIIVLHSIVYWVVRRGSFQNQLSIYGAILYVALPLFFLVSMSIDTSGGYDVSWVLLMLLLLWSSDSFAYVGGRLFGRHKLAPRISPNKTIEGLVVGIVLTIGLSIGLYALDLFGSNQSYTHAIAFGALVSVTGPLGDLFQSFFKRRVGIKDTGRILPGHGGILDRLDSFLFSLPFVYLYLWLTHG